MNDNLNALAHEALLAVRDLHRKQLRRDEMSLKFISSFTSDFERLRLWRQEKDLFEAGRRYDEACLCLYAALKYSPSQPRVPAGNSDGGQWTDGGGGGGATLDEGIANPTWSPFDIIGGIAVAAREALVGVGGYISKVFSRAVFGNAAEAVGSLEAGSVARGITPLTLHGGKRVGERVITDGDIQHAIRTAKEAGNVTSKIGKYNTIQKHYIGANGLKVIIETEGKNAGKVITTFWSKP